MYICKTCGKIFMYDWRKESGTKQRNIPLFCSRSCSSKRPHTQDTKEKIRKALQKRIIDFCKKCGRPLVYGHKFDYCRSCHSLIYPRKSKSQCVMEWRRRLKNKLVTVAGGRCLCCGYNKCSAALQFHHLDPTKKDFAISNKNFRAYNDYLIEIKKCILVCANCHMELHQGIRQYTP